ncbi:MAG TPA: FAD-dependent oxidoreductase [Ktedonobacterales bacterium]|nr:FAD-dependent oxidoreductase [Ktedonobacterales bacterium]
MDTTDVLVLGCGVSGLSTAILLQRQGRRVTIWARDVPPHTTSNIAAAVWYPYRAFPVDRVLTWGAIAYRAFREFLDTPESGVIVASVLDLQPERPPKDPWWASSVDGFRRAHPEELPAGYGDGFVFDAPVIDTSIYLGYLRSQFEAAGGVVVENRTVHDLAEAFAVYNVVVNCTGLGARELVHDAALKPSRGQVVRVRHNGFRRVMLDEGGPNQLAYIVPRINDIILGGTAIDGEESTAIDGAETPAILRRCTALAPEFAAMTPGDILEVKVGLRPVRPEVRLETETPAPGRWLISNYGHGGAGITLSWGCAAEVAERIEALATS